MEKVDLEKEKREHREALARQLVKARNDADLTQAELGGLVGRAPAWVSYLERGDGDAYWHHVSILARLLGVSTEMFRPCGVIEGLRAPRSLAEWETCYPDNPFLARAHFELDRSWMTHKKETIEKAQV